MSIFYRIIIILLIIVAGYTLYGIGHFKWMYHRTANPKADFQISGNIEGNLTLIEFLNYNCGYCRDLNPVVKELLEMRKDIRYIARPVSFQMFEPIEEAKEGEEPKEAKPIEDRTTKFVFAAGLQGKFWEMHDAVLEYPDMDIPDSFFEETANLYGIDYNQLQKDSRSKKIEKLINENLAAFNHVGLYSVPSFMMNGKIYVITDGKLPNLKTLLDFVASAEKE